jgi:hypothetical protein
MPVSKRDTTEMADYNRLIDACYFVGAARRKLEEKTNKRSLLNLNRRPGSANYREIRR